MISSYSAVGGLGLGYVDMEQVSEVITLITSLVLSYASSFPLITEILELVQLKNGTAKPVLQEDFSQCINLVTLLWLSSV